MRLHRSRKRNTHDLVEVAQVGGGGKEPRAARLLGQLTLDEAIVRSDVCVEPGGREAAAVVLMQHLQRVPRVQPVRHSGGGVERGQRVQAGPATRVIERPRLVLFEVAAAAFALAAALGEIRHPVRVQAGGELGHGTGCKITHSSGNSASQTNHCEWVDGVSLSCRVRTDGHGELNAWIDGRGDGRCRATKSESHLLQSAQQLQ